MKNMIEYAEKNYLIDEINYLIIRFTGTSLTEEEIVKKLNKPLDKLRAERDRKVMMYNMHNIGWN
jgi:hypothetical protein